MHLPSQEQLYDIQLSQTPRDRSNTVQRSVWLDMKYAKLTAITECVDELCARERTVRLELQPVHSVAKRRFRLALACLIGSFAKQLSLRFDDRNYVAISLNNNGLKGVEFPFSVEILRTAVMLLKRTGYIRAVLTGYIDRQTGEGFVGRYEATDKLIDLLEEKRCLLVQFPHQTTLRFASVPFTSRIAHGKGEERSYEGLDHDESETTLSELRALIDNCRISIGPVTNTALESAFDYHNDRLKFKTTRNILNGDTIYRQYSGDTKTGGRFVLRSVQSLPKLIRASLLFDGAQTSELDYGSMQFNLALKLEGLEAADEDIYESLTCRFISRDDVKDVLTVALGEKSEALFRRNQAYKPRSEQAAGSLNNALLVIDRFRKRYPALQKYLFSQSWKVLQHEESNIALRVMTDLVEEGILVLPIHESFIVKKKYEGTLREVMERHFPGCPVK